MAATGRGPIKVGSGYIEINPRLSEEAVRKFRAEMAQDMEKAGLAAGKEFTAATAEGMKGLSRAVRVEAKKAGQAAEAEAKDSAEVIAKIEADLTKQYGEQAVKRFREAKQFEEKKQALAEETSKVTQAALAATLRAETEAGTLAAKAQQQNVARKEKAQAEYERYVRTSNERIARQEAADIATSAKTVQAAEKAKQKAAAETAKVRQRALEDEARVDREIYATQQRLARESAAAQQQAYRDMVADRRLQQKTAIAGEIQVTEAVKANLLEQIAAHRQAMASISTAQATAFASMKKKWRGASQDVENMGTLATETGALITSKVIAPLGIAGTAISVIGIKSADSFAQSQTALKKLGLTISDTTGLLDELQKYGVATPYSIDDMVTYGTQFTRAIGSHNKQFGSKDPKVHAKGSKQVAGETYQLVSSIGDIAAAGGVTDPNRVAKAFGAMEKMIDTNRASLTNIKQLETNLNLPMEHIAKLMGLKDRPYTDKEYKDLVKKQKDAGLTGKIPKEYTASAQMMYISQNAKATGGIRGEAIKQAILDYGGENNVKGAAASLSSSTISGRLSNMKEAGGQYLRSLFQKKGKDGQYEYTSVGASLMGHRVKTKDGTVQYQGGMLQKLPEIGRNMKPTVEKILKTFAETLTTFVDWISKLTDFLKAHPQITDFVLKIAKMAALAAPFLIGFGVLSKTVGKLGKMFQLMLGPAKLAGSALGGIAKGARGTFRYGRQVASGVKSARSGDGFLSGYDSRRDQYTATNDRRARDRQRVGNSSRENGVFRTAAGYGRLNAARVTGYDSFGDWRTRRRNLRSDNNHLDNLARRAAGRGELSEANRLRDQREQNTQNYRDSRRERRRTAAQRVRPTDSVDARNAHANNLSEAEKELRKVQEELDRLKDALKSVDRLPMTEIINRFGGRDNSIRSSAHAALGEVRQVRTDGIEPLNHSNLTQIQGEITQTHTKTGELIAELKNAQQEVTQLDVKKLTALKVEVDGAHGTVTDLKNKIDDTAHSVVVLDGKKLEKLKGEFTAVTTAADHTYKKVGDGNGSGELQGRVKGLNDRKLTTVKKQFENLTAASDATFRKIGQGTGGTSLAGRVGLLNGRSLKDIKSQFDKLTTAADKAYEKVGQGTGGSSLAGRVGLLNNRSLKDVKDQVDHLKTSLHLADHEAGNLNSSLDDIAKHKSGGSSGSGKPRKPKKPYTGGVITSQGNLAHFATGGVLPGYMPGVDSVPAILSPGEAILRPEVTATLGAPLIHSWNAMARKGQLSRYAGGGIVGRFGIDKIIDMIHMQNVWPDASGAINTMAFDATSMPIGGDVQSGMLATGTGASRYVGSDVATKFDGIYNFVTQDSWKFLKRLPTVVGQAIGILGGTFAPMLGEYFHDDVWKGNGNILDRGEAFLGDVFSTKTLTGAFDNLFGGVWDSVKSIVGGAKDLITDPVGSVKKTVDALWQVGTGEVTQVIDMVKAVKQISSSPLDYAGDVLSDVYSTAKEALPNTKGLFDFSDKDQLNAKKPGDISAKYSMDDPPGKGVQRWKPSVTRVLKELGLSLDYTDLVLHRIQVESGGNPKAINNWDSNAKAGYPSQGLMQTIPQTFAAYAGPYKKLGITNGLASIYAGLNYATHRYGSGWPKALSGVKGYWTGTPSASPGLALVGERGPELINFSGGERVYNDQDTAGILGGKKYEIHIHEAKAENTTQSVLRAMQYAEALHGGL
jgi:SLT domain-containing protein